MTIYVCKMCGRSMKSEIKPNYCYADRVDSIENIGDEDAVKMGLFHELGLLHCISIMENDGNGFNFEFPGDVKFHPYTGESLNSIGGRTLHKFQDKIMEKVNDR